MPQISDYELERLQSLDTVRYWLWRCLTVALVLFVAGMWGCPKYEVWQQGLKGQAELARAEQNRQIAVQAGKAKMDASTYLAAADTERAHGVARSNQIIGRSLSGPEGAAYLRWLWIHTLNDSTKQVIYIPTEASFPILEAGKRRP